jgi:hypothetical protein
MTVRLYDIARFSWGRGRIDWLANTMRACIPKNGYVLSQSAHSYLSTLQPLRGLTAVANRTISTAGWMGSDMIQFAEVPINEPIDCVVIHRVSDGMLIAHISFPTVTVQFNKALFIRQGISRPGLFRL